MKGILLKAIILILFTSANHKSHGQRTQIIDSLKSIVTENNATDSVTALRHYLIAKLSARKNKDSGLYYFHKLEDYSSKNNSSYGKYFIHFYKVKFLDLFIDPASDSKYDFVKSNMNECIKYAREVNDSRLVCKSYNRIASEERSRDNKTQMIVYNKKALKAALEYDDKDQIALAHLLIGFHYLVDFKDYENSLSHMMKADSLFTLYDLDEDNRATNIANMGNVYYHMKDKTKALEQYLKAIAILDKSNNEYRKYYVLGRVAKLKLDNKEYVEGIRILHECYDYYKRKKKYNNWKANALRLSQAYLNIDQKEKSIKYVNIALDIAKKRGYQAQIAEAMLYKCDILYKTGDYQQSYNIALEAKNVSQKNNSLLGTSNALKLLHKNAAKLNRHREAYQYLSEFKQARDSIKSTSNLEKALELETQYQTAKKEQEISLLKSQKLLALHQKKNQQYLFLGGIFITILGGVLFLIMYLNKQKINKRLTALNKAKTTFFENISHEFRTPLTLIKLPVSKALNEDIRLSKHHLNTIHSNASRLQALVEDLLTLSEMDAGKMHTQRTEQNPLKQALILSSQFNSYAESSDITYINNIKSSPVSALYDSKVVIKVLSNLITNAIKYSRPGDTVSVDVYVENKSLIMKVSDNGEGISETDQKLIFDRFYQVNNKNESTPSTGIGLSLVKKMLELNDGSVSVKSKEGEGSTFTAILPLQKIQVDNLVENSNINTSSVILEQEHKLTPNFDLSDKPELLIVEDNIELLQYIKELFEKDYKIHTATNGQEGLEKATKVIPDFIISDWMMPIMDGIEFCEKIKTSTITSHIPFLMLTAKANVNDKVQGYDTGADAYFSKPFNYRELQAQIKSILKQQALLKDRFKDSYEIEPKSIAVNNHDEMFWENFISFLNEHMGDPELAVDGMAKQLSVSRMQLHRKVKTITGLSPSAIIVKQRMKTASTLLKKKGSRISEVSLMVGYLDPQSFSRTFKKELSMTPSQYKKEYDEKH